MRILSLFLIGWTSSLAAAELETDQLVVGRNEPVVAAAVQGAGPDVPRVTAAPPIHDEE